MIGNKGAGPSRGLQVREVEVELLNSTAEASRTRMHWLVVDWGVLKRWILEFDDRPARELAQAREPVSLGIQGLGSYLSCPYQEELPRCRCDVRAEVL